MKKIYFLLLAMVTLFTTAFGQVSNYGYAASSGASFETITSPTTLTLGVGATIDDDYNTISPASFVFKYNGVDYTQFGLSTNGYIRFGSGTATSIPSSLTSMGYNAVIAYGRDGSMNTTNGGNHTHGPAAGGKYVFQFTKLSGGASGAESATSFCTIQIVLWGSTSGRPGQIDIIYGTSAGSTPTGGTIGITDAASTYINGLTGSNSVASTTTSWPVSGTMYTFSPPPPCAAPTSLAATVTVTPGIISAAGSFTAAPPTVPTGYLVVRTTTNTQPVPVDGTNYTVGSNAIGYIEYAGTAAGSWTSTGLSAGTTYYYWVFSYNNSPCTGPVYSTTTTNTSVTTGVCSISGVKSVGPGGDYATLKAAVDAVVANGITSSVILELNSSYTNTTDATFPIVLGQVPCAAAGTTITIRPAAGAGAKTITGSATTAILDINGGNYWIIDGRQGGTGSSKDLTIANTSAATGGAAIRFINEGANNTAKYLVLKGAYASSTSAVVFFSTTTGTNGNDNNIIDNCDIDGGAAASASPTTAVAQNGIYSSGSTGTAAQNNSGNTVSNCNIFNFFVTGATATTAGILLSSGNTDWTINANSIYQTASRVVTTGAATIYGISIANTSGNNFIVTNNFIGGTAASAGGAAWNVTGTFANRFNGIGLSVGTTTASSVQGNTVANFAFTSSSAATANSTSAPLGTGIWGGIMIAAGNANVGNIAANNIGSATGTGSVTVTSTTTGGTANGIGISGSGTVVVSGNNIGSMTATSVGATVSTGLIGIQSAGTGTVTINNNIIGSTTTVNSMNASFGSTGTTAQVVNGIINTGGATAINITNNTIANLNNAYLPGAVNTSRLMVGIASSSGVNTITGNTIRNFTTAAQGTGTTSAASIIGISVTTGTAGSVVSLNTIHTLSNTHATAATLVTGIYYNGATSGTNVVARNFVHSLNVSTSSAAGNITGIYIGGGIANYQNNFIRLGINSAGAALANNIIMAGIDKQTTSSNNIYFNSVYIGGAAGVATTANTFAFRRASTGTDILQNNIFFNARSNGSGGTGKHYAAGLNAITTLSINSNDYFANGTGGIIGYVGTPGTTDYNTLATFAAATTQDAQSLNIDPTFVNPAIAIPDLHIVSGTTLLESGAVAVPSITNDFDGDVRPGAASGSNTGLSSDIGADEFNGINPNVCSGTPASGGTLTAPVSFTCSGSSVTFTLTGATGGPGITYQYQTSPAGAGTFTDIGGATTVVSSFPITGNTDIRVVVKCTVSGLTINSNIITVNGGFCTFNVAKSATTYSSIAGTGAALTGWRNLSLNISDDNLSTAQNIGFNFNYKGQVYTQFSASSNGYLTFNVGTAATGTGTGAYGYQNTTFSASSGGTYLALAPFYDDQVCAGNPGTVAALAASIKYQLDGVAPNRVMTLEWIGMETFNNAGPNLNYQVKLYETTGVIEYVYGTMELFNGTADFSYSYSIGLNGASVSASPTALELQTQQVANVQNFAPTASNALTKFLDCNTKFTFTPAAYSGAASTPALPNDEAATATTVSVNSSPCTSLCGTYYSATGATASAGIPVCSAATPGNADDDIWFKFTATASAANITVKAGGAYDPVVQLFSDAGITSLACVNATGTGLTETLNGTGLTAGNVYYVRVYHAGTGTGAVADISICVNEVVIPPSNDDPCGAYALTVGTGTCTPYEDNPASLPSKTAFIAASTTTSNGVATPSCSGALATVQDVWFSFVANSTDQIITVVPKAGTNAAFQVYSSAGTCPGLTLTSLSCVNANSTGGTETSTVTGLTSGNTYYVRVYAHPSGQGGAPVSNSQFSICVTSPPLPSCVTNTTPPNNAVNQSATPTLTWATDPNATSYDVYLGTPNAAAATLVTNVTTASYTVTPALAFSTVYYWYVVPRNGTGTASGCIANATSFTTFAGPPSNDDCATAVNLVHSTSPTVFNYVSGYTTGATASTEGSSCFSSSQDDDVWYSFTATSTIALIKMNNIVITTGSGVTAMGIGIHATCGTTDLVCAFPTITAGLSTFTVSGLTVGTVYKLRVLTSGTSGTVSFDICVTVPPVAGGTANACETEASVTIGAGNNSIWVPLFDANANLVGEINANGNNLGSTTVAFYKNTGAVRGGSPGNYYMDRNVAITPTVQPTVPTTVSVKLYFTAAEYAALQAAEPSLTNPNLLNINKTSGGCSPTFVGPGTFLAQSGSGSYGNDYYVTFETPDFSNFFLKAGLGVVPVSIEYFKGSKTTAGNYLNWKITCTSAPSVDITLERSGDGRSFKGIDQQNATAARCLQEFNYTDRSPLSGINYYRVKTVSPDGKVSYSSIVALISKDKGFELISVAPNPVQNNTVLTISTVKSGMMSISVSDLAGRVIKKQNVSVIAGSNAVNLNFSSLAAGTYSITAIDADGEKKTTSFVKY